MVESVPRPGDVKVRWMITQLITWPGDVAVDDDVAVEFVAAVVVVFVADCVHVDGVTAVADGGEDCYIPSSPP